MTTEQFKSLALSFPNTIASPHFDRIAYKVLNKKIFATLHQPTETANLKFSVQDQSVFCLCNKEEIFPVNNKWGLQGWTTFVLPKIDHQLMQEALDTAYKETLVKTQKKK